jgi:hypothetical protein
VTAGGADIYFGTVKKTSGLGEAGNYLHHPQDRAPLPEDFWLSRPRSIAPQFSVFAFTLLANNEKRLTAFHLIEGPAAGRRQAMAEMGYEERLPPIRMSAGCGFRKETIAGMRRNGRDAPIAAICARRIELAASTLSGRS